MNEFDDEAVAAYLQSRRVWHLQVKKMGKVEKDRTYANLTFLWGRMGKAEQRIAGAEACMRYH